MSDIFAGGEKQVWNSSISHYMDSNTYLHYNVRHKIMCFKDKVQADPLYHTHLY